MDPSSSVTLTRLLARLNHTLLTPTDPEHLSRLRGSPYERNKVGANLEHARTLLLTLEKEAATIRVQSQRQRTQAELQTKRELVERLNARLEELSEEGEEENSDDEDTEEEEDEKVAASYAPARKDTEDGLDTGGGGEEEQATPLISQPEPQQTNSPPPELRQRRLPTTSAPPSTTTARDQLFTHRSQPLQQSETLTTHNRHEQETLTTGLLGLARALKESSLSFSSSLESEKTILQRAEGGLDKSSRGMEAAGRKMGTLRRMSEGQGLWGRLKLYAFILGLWVVCFVVVFVGPKLRF